MKITLANLHLATAQQVFDQVVNHLRAQGQQCLSNTGACVYRNESGLMCAASCLISDEEYLPKMEDRTWVGLINDGIVKTENHVTLITDLQRIHDTSSVDTWEGDFEFIAYKYKLVFTAV